MLYHYCSLDSFISIIKNKCFWLSDVRKSNDRDECMYLFKLLKASVGVLDDTPSEIQNAALKYISDYEKQYEYGTGIRKYVSLGQLDSGSAIDGDEYEADIRIPSVYVLCLSEDSDLLSQWRGYAADGGGISIGLRTDFLDQDGSGNFVARTYDGNYKFLSCEQIKYRIGDQYQAVKNVRTALYEKCEKRIEIEKSSEDTTDTTKKMKVLQQDIWDQLRNLEYQGVTNKGDGFSEEKEHRIIDLDPEEFYPGYSIGNDFKNMSDEDKHYWEERAGFSLSDLKFRARGSDIVSYRELHFDKIKDCLIGEIILGPKCKARTSDIELMLQSFGYKNLESIYIHRSPLGYR